MELSQLRYFHTLAKREHFTRAAEELHISQPSLSKSISNLENELGVLLFDRYNRSVRLNGYGKALLRHVEKLLFEADEAVMEIRDMKEGKVGDIHMASTFHLDFPGGLTAFIRRFLFDHPDISLHMFYTDSSSMADLLSNRKIAFALTTERIGNPDIVSEELFSYSMGVVVNRNDPLAHRASVCVSELRDCVFLSNNSSPDQHDSIYDICAQAGFRPRVKLECDNADIIGEAVSRGLGISFATEHRFLINNEDEDEDKLWRKELVFVPVTDDFCVRTICLSYLREAYHTFCERNFLSDIRQFFEAKEMAD